jgi:phosphoserine phosphatase
MKKSSILIFSVLLFLAASCCNDNQGTERKPLADTLINADATAGNSEADRDAGEKSSQASAKPKKEDRVPPMPKKPEPKRRPIANPLSSWQDNAHKQRIIDYVKSTTTKGSKSFIDYDRRIAVFDNDGTLWSEKPTYFQIEFVFYRIKQMAPEHPEWKRDRLIKMAINHDLDGLRKKYGAPGIGRLLQITQTGMTPAAFEKIVRQWLNNARHPETGQLYRDMVYRPMVELVDYLKANNFQVYLVSGAELDFVRAMSEDIFHIPKNHVIASWQKLELKVKNGQYKMIKTAEHLNVIDSENKPVAIQQFIGIQPVIAVGNSDGDLDMLAWCATNTLKNLPIVIHHTDSLREWAYDKVSKVGVADKILVKAKQKSWLVVDMAKDWKVIYYGTNGKNPAISQNTEENEAKD